MDALIALEKVIIARRKSAIQQIMLDCRLVMGYEPCFAWLNSLSLEQLLAEAACLAGAVEALDEADRQEEAKEQAEAEASAEEARNRAEDARWDAFYKLLER